MNIKCSIQKIKGIGDKKRKKLNSIEIYTIEDLMYYFPRTFEYKNLVTDITKINNNEDILIKGTIKSIEEKTIKKNLHLTKLYVISNRVLYELILFNQRHVKKVYKINDNVYCFGNYEYSYKKHIIKVKELKIYNNEILENSIEPVYKLLNGISNLDIKKAISFILLDNKIEIADVIPRTILEKNNLCGIDYALKNIHFPKNKQFLKEALYRLIFEEFFLIQSGLLYFKHIAEVKNAPIILKTSKIDKFIKSLAFELTNAQKKVIEEVYSDLKKGNSMNRLIQGDVGSGKTIIAIIFLCELVFNGFQGAFMVPTEVLANQHFESLKELLEPFDLNIELITSSISKKNKITILENLKNGKIDIIIGTHALLQDNVIFKNLGIVVTDEQHRFGVSQRNQILSKGESPHLLVMSATPIPRTLALMLHGDLNVSIIDELPPGRKPIKTISVNQNSKNKVYEKALYEIKKGRQVYVVCSLIEDSENIEAVSANYIFESIKTKFCDENLNIKLVHGKISTIEKETIMNEFKDGSVDILIATTVIEVGINVPNASVMIIENSERFGLSQLHQLRGRVGRGNYESFCFLINYNSSEISSQRMKVMESSNDGFFISQKDLELRGPGEFFGVKQHGIPELKLANMSKHINILKKAQQSSFELFQKDPLLVLEENKQLKESILKKYQPIINSTSLN